MSGLSTKLGYACAILILLYFIVYALACPTRELVAAVALEVFVFIAVLGFRMRKQSRHSREAQEVILDELSRHTRVAQKSWKSLKIATLVATSMVLSILTFDFIALTLTGAHQFDAARRLYLINPIYRIPGVHPALSAELLAGANIEVNRLDEAETLSHFLLDIRKEIYGERHAMIAEMYGNFAFINLKRGDAVAAEKYARTSIALWKETEGYHHLGNALTKLGNALSMQKRYDEAEAVLEEALQMRTREFGASSPRVLTTMRDLESSQMRAGKTDAARITRTRVQRIEAWQKAHHSMSSENTPWLIPMSIAISFIASYILFGPKGILTNLALRRIETRVKQEGSQANPRDIRQLISLYRHRKDLGKVEYYQQMLTR